MTLISFPFLRDFFLNGTLIPWLARNQYQMLALRLCCTVSVCSWPFLWNQSSKLHDHFVIACEYYLWMHWIELLWAEKKISYDLTSLYIFTFERLFYKWHKCLRLMNFSTRLKKLPCFRSLIGTKHTLQIPKDRKYPHLTIQILHWSS